MAEACGAKTRSGSPCKRAPAKGAKRCKLHGGASTGPKPQPGSIYSEYLTPEERAAWETLELGRIDNELRLMRIRLARILKAEKEADGSPELDEVTQNDGGGVTVPVETRKSKVRDYQAMIDKTMARIESLERTRKMLDAGEGDNDGIAGFETLPYDE
ncbi:MAG: hypothetical protein KGL39_11085 [Patescibacteria group bacterium]|nr:hypothetical protein [Patescibacteria group bacterium]